MAPGSAHPRITGTILSLWRCGDPSAGHPIFSGLGAGLFPGRWNTPASPMIYASETFSTALLEKLAHLNGVLPDNMHGVEVVVPDGVSIEHFDVHAIPDWVSNETATKTRGDAWYHAKRSLLLRVPSVPAAMVDHNVLINPTHPDFARLATKTPFPVHWDARLFS